jgi:hypothetical protein
MVITSNQKQVLIVLGALLVATGIGFLYWRNTPRRIEVKLNRENRKALEEAELD